MKAEHNQNGLPTRRDISFHAERQAAPTSPCVVARPARHSCPRGCKVAVPDHHGSSLPHLSATSHGCPPAMPAAQAAFSRGIGVPGVSFSSTGFVWLWGHCTKWDLNGSSRRAGLVYHSCFLEVLRDSVVPWQLTLPSSP